VPLSLVAEVVLNTLEPALRATLQRYPSDCRQQLPPDFSLTCLAASGPPPNSTVAPCVVALIFWPHSGRNELVACLQKELESAESSWRPDLREHLREKMPLALVGMRRTIEEN
jgi:hypothetical protein